MTNPKSTTYPDGSPARFQSDTFNRFYTNMLIALQQAFSGQPGKIDDAVGLMFNLKLQAIRLMQLPADPSNPSSLMAAPTWEYLP